MIWDFPGGPVVRTSPSNAGGVGLIPGGRAKIPHASWPKKRKEKNQNIKQKRYCNKFNKDLKKMVNIKKKPLEKKRKKENSSSSDVEMCLKLYLQWPLSSIWYA